MGNGRFAIAVHILTLLEKSADELLPSELIAGSINVNPVLVRKEIAHLKKAGFVSSKEGKSGGCRLAMDAAKINLGDVFTAVYPDALLSFARNTPNQKCPIGKNINTHLEELYAKAENALCKKLKESTLREFSKKFN